MNWRRSRSSAPFLFCIVLSDSISTTPKLFKYCFIFSALGLSLLLVSCSHSNKVIYAKYGRLKLTGQEVNSYPVAGNDVRLFETCCYTGSDLIFLNRAIHEKAGKYDIYISVSEQLMPGQLQQIIAANPDFRILQSKSSLVGKTKVDAYLLKRGEGFLTRFVYVETKSGLLVIYDLSSKDEAVVQSFYNDMSNYLDEKIRL